MSKQTDIRLVEVSSQVQSIEYRTPIKFGGRVVTDAAVFDVRCVVETRLGNRGQGLGSMPLGNVWAWPSENLEPGTTLRALQQLAERIVAEASAFSEFGHPLELTTALEGRHKTLAQEVGAERSLAEPIPKLAQLVAASPLEAAIHDAYGKVLEQNSYNVLGKEFVNQDLGSYLGSEFAGEYLDQYTLRQPKDRMPLYHLVGALDPLSPEDLSRKVGDGLPETLAEWIAADGLTHLKIKLNGDDLSWDVHRVVAIESVAERAQRARGCDRWFYSLDFNEKCQDVAYVLEFLAQLNQRSPQAWQRVQYIEQPTHRDLAAHPDNQMHQAAAIKPVVIDESLVDLASLQLARQQGYSGVALKACKGQTGALLMAAAAQKFGLFLCVQDLTCPGASFLHSATLAARIPTVAAIEGNARQYCPAGNQGWSDRFPGMFHLHDGTLQTGSLVGPGLWGASL